MKKIAIYFIVLLLLYSGGVLADDLTRAGSVGAQFLKIAVGSRYQGMGESSVAVVNDAYSMYWNPAGMANVEANNIAFTNVDWLAGVRLNYIAVSSRIEGFGVIGFSATLMDIGEMEVTTIDDPDGTGEMFSASSLALTASYANYLTTRLAFGASIKYIYEKIYSETAGGIAFDFGTQLQTGFRSLRIGMNIANMGPDLRFSGPNLSTGIPGTNTNGSIEVDAYSLPLTFRLGMAYDFIDDAENKLTVAMEAKHPNDNEQQMSLGTEYRYRNNYFLRTGYKFKYAEQGITFGGGVIAPLGQNNQLVLDYAWSDFGRLESVHRFSLGINF